MVDVRKFSGYYTKSSARSSLSLALRNNKIFSGKQKGPILMTRELEKNTNTYHT